MFFDCFLLRTFLSDIEKWLQTNILQSYRINRLEFLFGILIPNTFIVNFVQLHVKWFIHRAWQRHKELNRNTALLIELSQFLNYLRYVLDVEKQMSIDSKGLQHYEVKFDEVAAKL